MQVVDRSSGRVKYEYPREQFPLAELVARMFDVLPEQMARLHDYSRQQYTPFSLGKEHLTEFHETYYFNVHPPTADGITSRPTELGQQFLDVYGGLVAQLENVHFRERTYFQKIPSFRIHLPRNLAIADTHRDKDDGQPPEEQHVFLPLSNAFGNNTVWAESEPDKHDFSPLEADVGQFICWNGAYLLHRNRLNDTGLTRVSVDFRLIPVSQYVHRPELVSSVMKIPMVPGHYYTLLEY